MKNDYSRVIPLTLSNSRMEAFVKSLKNVHEKLYKGVHRDPSYILLPVDEYPVPVEELDEMFDLIIEISRKEILEDNKVYDMVQEVISCMRDTGMIDNYLFLMFMEGSDTFEIASMFTTTIIDSTIEDDHKSRSEKLFCVEDRLDNIMNVMSLRDPDHVEEDNERYGDMEEMLSRMEAIVKNLKIKFDQDEEEKNAATVTSMEAFVKALNDVHDKLCKEDIVYREPSEELLSEEEYLISVVEFEQMYDLMMEVSNYKENIQQNQEVYDMLQDVMSCMRDTGMIDSYLRLVFTRGLDAGMIANKLISNTIRDYYETRIGKLLFIKERIDIITSLIYKRCLLYTSPSPRDATLSRMPSSA